MVLAVVSDLGEKMRKFSIDNPDEVFTLTCSIIQSHGRGYDYLRRTGRPNNSWGKPWSLRKEKRKRLQHDILRRGS